MKVKGFFAVGGDDDKGGSGRWLLLVEAQRKCSASSQQRQRPFVLALAKPMTPDRAE
jgi:hypothetical protein